MSDLEVPDADAAEQAQPVDEAPEPEPLTSDPEVPEADALEQAQEVPADPAEDL
jgi:hypothetical protein